MDLGSMPEDGEFVGNKCALRSKKVVVIDHNLTIEVWFNRHYYERYYFGDERGKREGIEPEVVESLVTRLLPHLFWYSTIVSGFNFVNYEGGAKHINRVVLKEVMNGTKFNVVVEVHFLSLNQFEVSVVTAMTIDNFKMFSG